VNATHRSVFLGSLPFSLFLSDGKRSCFIASDSSSVGRSPSGARSNRILRIRDVARERFLLSRVAREFFNNARAESRYFAASLTRKASPASSACLQSESTPNSQSVCTFLRASSILEASLAGSFSRGTSKHRQHRRCRTDIAHAMTNHVACRVKC
jgi:hypothetical protein